jgi:hypothetical protein
MAIDGSSRLAMLLMLPRFSMDVDVQGEGFNKTNLNTGGQPMLGGEGKERRGEGVFILNFCQAMWVSPALGLRAWGLESEPFSSSPSAKGEPSRRF